MATMSSNNRYATLDGMNVFYDEEADVFTLVAVDSDLIQHPFSILIEKGTQADASLRNLAASRKLVSTTAVLEEKKVERDFLIPVGLTSDRQSILWNSSVTPHLIVSGADEEKRSLFVSGLVEYGIDAHNKHLLELHSAALYDEDSAEGNKKSILYVHDLMMRRYEEVMAEDAESYDTLTESESSRRIILLVQGDPAGSAFNDSAAVLRKIISLGSSVNVHVVLDVEHAEPLLVNGMVDEAFTRVLFDDDAGSYNVLFGSAPAPDLNATGGDGYIQSSGLSVKGLATLDVVPLTLSEVDYIFSQ